MGIYVKVDKVEEREFEVIYKYCSNNIDWGYFSVDKNNIKNLEVVELAKNDPEKQYLFRALSAINRDLNKNNIFPDKTCFAS